MNKKNLMTFNSKTFILLISFIFCFPLLAQENPYQSNKALIRASLAGSNSKLNLSNEIRSKEILVDIQKLAFQSNVSRSKSFSYSTSRLQEVIWEIYDSGEIELSHSIESLLVNYLKIAPIKKMIFDFKDSGLGKYQSRAYKVVFTSGISGVFKPADDQEFHNHLYEIAAYKFDRLIQLNMIPVTIERIVGQFKGSLQLFVQGSEMESLPTPQEKLNLNLQERTWAKMNLFDFLIDSQDRLELKSHRKLSNILFSDRGRRFLIDNGYSFGKGTVLNSSFDESHLMPEWRKLDDILVADHYFPGKDIFSHLLALNEKSINQTLGEYVPPEEIKLLIDRLSEVTSWFERTEIINGTCARLFK